MSTDDKNFISEAVGVEPIKINSALLTAQTRNRYYWTNIPNLRQPRNAHISLADILENDIDEKYFIDWQNRKGKKIVLTGKEKTPTTLIEIRTEQGEAERIQNKELLSLDTNTRNKDTAQYIAGKKKKANCLTGAIHPVNLLVVQDEEGFGQNSVAARMPTPIECERLQGFPDNRTLVPWANRMMSDTQRYKQTGNAVTVNVIQHIFEALKKHLISTVKRYQQSGAYSYSDTPLPFPKKKKTYKKVLTEKQYVAYYKYSVEKQKSKGLSLQSQKAIVQHFSQKDKATIMQDFIDQDGNTTNLQKAVKFCQRKKYTLIIAHIDSIFGGIENILQIKKKLKNRFISCDLPSSDGLTLSIYYSVLQRQKELNSIKTGSVNGILSD